MNRHCVIGFAKQIDGMIKEFVGRLVGFSRLVDEGRAERAEGKAQSRLGRWQINRRS